MVPVFNQYCREFMCFAQGHNMVPLDFEPSAPLGSLNVAKFSNVN